MVGGGIGVWVVLVLGFQLVFGLGLVEGGSSIGTSVGFGVGVGGGWF